MNHTTITMAPVLKPTNFDFSILKYSEPKINSHNGGQTVFVNDQQRNKIRICTPKCYLPFGISEYNDQRSLQFSLDTVKNDDFIKFIQSFDKLNIKTATENSSSWFKKSLNSDTISELYNSSLKQNNPKYPPMLKAKLPCKSGVFVGEIYDKNRTLIDMSSITKGCYVEAIIELTGIYFVAKEFGMSWKVIQLKVFPSEKLTGYAFNDDSSSDDEDEAVQIN
jgi:hypothetical protein